MSKKKIKSKYKPDFKFVALPISVLNHPDFLKLNWAAQCLLFHMLGLYTGFNNGDISIALSDMQKKGWSKGTLERAKKDLLVNDWIRLTRQGGKYYSCCLYAISWIELDECKGKFNFPVKDYIPRSLK